MTANVTAIILTNNEEKHLERCILSLKNIIKRIVVIDSLSTDKTHEILKIIICFKKNGLIIQLNWGIEKAEVKIIDFENRP